MDPALLTRVWETITGASGIEWDVDKALLVLTEAIDWVLKHGVETVPELERALINVVDYLFSFKQVVRQLGLLATLQVLVICYSSLNSVWQHVLHHMTEYGRKEKALKQRLRKAGSYDEWQQIAVQLDTLRGHQLWREEEDSLLYDSKMLQKRIAGTEEMLRRGDVFNLMFRLRGGLARDQFGMQHEGLFSRAQAGTKLLVERYLETMSAGLRYICDSPIADEEIPTDAKLAFFNETRHSYGRTALVLSGGASLGFYHMGVVKALRAQGLLPRVVSGASAGSIITGIVGVRTEAELDGLLGGLFPPGSKELHLPDEMKIDFFRVSSELKSKLARRLNYLVPQGLRWLTLPIFSFLFDKKMLNFDTEHLKDCLRANIGPYTFQEAFDRTGRIINITVAPLNQYDPPRLLNYLTAPHVCVWSAVAASCALPGVFEPVSLIVKEPNGAYRPENEWTRQALVDNEDIKAANLHSYSDGSLENDLPMQQLSELFNVNHFIVSQVNPHSALLTFMATANVWSNPLFTSVVGYMRFLTAQTRDWIKNVVNLFVFRSLAPIWSTRRGFAQTLTQDYEGREVDVTINPWFSHLTSLQAFSVLLKNRTNAELKEVMVASEAATWPSIPRIRAHCLVEMTLDQCVQRLRKRISDESHAAHVLALHAHAQAQAQHGSKDGSGHLDRTPSFYTSHSLVNLSGLSVADPAPIHIWRPGHAHSSGSSSAGVLMELDPTASTQEQEQKLGGRGGDGGSREKDLVMLPVTLRRGSWSFGSAGALSDAGAGPGSLDDSSHGAEAVALHHQQQQQQLRGSLRRVSIREEESEVEGGVQTEGADGDFLTLTVPMGEVSLDALHGPESYSYYTDAAFSARDSPHEGAKEEQEEEEEHGLHHSAGYIPARPASAPAHATVGGTGADAEEEELNSGRGVRRMLVRRASAGTVWPEAASASRVHARRGLTCSDSAKAEEHVIHKTTNMANFYYRRSHSNPNLQDATK